MTMAATTNIFKDKETNNWFKACIALNVTKEGLTNFVEMTMKKVHAAIGSRCGQCTIEQLFPCSTQGLCNKRKRNSCSFHKSYLPQQCHICEQVKLGIISYHRFKGPSWKNTNAQSWKSNWWDIAKCYLPPQGYADMSSVQESDFNAVINIILNCTDFENYLSPSWLSPPPPDQQCPLEKVRQIGRNVRHSANCKTTDAELQDYFQILTRLLADPVCLAHDKSANIALSRLTDLQNDRRPLTEFGNLIQEFKQAIERVKDAAEEEFSEKAKHTLEKGFNKIKEAMKDSEQVIGKKMDENIQTLYDRTEYCKQQIGDQTSKAEHTIQTKTCVSITQIDTLTKSSVQLIEDHTRVNMERMQLKIDDKAEEDYERGLEVIKGRQVIESATMEGRDAVISATEASVTEIKATVIKGQQVVESATIKGHDAVSSATETGVTEVKATVIKGQWAIESATMEGHDAVTSATKACVTEVNATMIKGQQVVESATMEGRDAVIFATEAGVTEVQATVIKGEWVIESATMEGHDAVTSATEAGVTEVKATVIKGQRVVESATMEGHDAVSSATEAGVTEVRTTVIKGQQVIESAKIEGNDAITSATEAGVTEVKTTVNKGQWVIESATMEGHDAVTSATEAGVTEVNVTVIKGQGVVESATMEGHDALTSATEAGVTEVKATVIKGQRVIESATMEGCDAVTSATEAGVTELSKQAKTLLADLTKDSIGIKTQKEDTDFEMQCNDFIRRLIDHYRHSVICVPLSTLDTSLNKRIQDIYATPKIHKMEIEKDGKRVQQEQIHKYSDCFSGGLSRIYLQGEPGSGKSYFATKLVHDWCNVHAPIVKSTKEQKMFGDVDTLQKFRVLVFISLRDSREQTHVTRMIETQLIHKMYPEDEWESAYKLVLKILKNVMYLIIQDGLDEWPCIESMPVMDGIPKDQCIVLTTSRPWKLADKRISNLQIDILLGLEGISNPKESNENILRCLLDESNDIKESVKLFKKFLRSHNLESISSSPMLNTLVLCTWVDDGAKRLTGSSLCELYTTMLDNMCIKANSQTGYFDRYHPLPVNCFSLTEYVKPNMEHIDAIAKAAFSFLFSNKKESSLVFSDIDLRAHLPETAKQFALDSGLLSERKGKKRTDQTVSFVHKTIQEFLTAFHIHMNADVIDGVISGYLKCHDNSYLDISQMFIFLCGFNISAAHKLSTLMNELDFNSKFDDSFQNELAFNSKFDDSFQNCILSGYREAVANKNTPIHLHLSHFKFDNSDDAKDLIQLWALNTSRARSLCVSIDNKPVTIRSQDASSSRCQGPGPVALPARKDHGVSTRDDEEQFRSSESGIEIALSSCHNLERLKLRCYEHLLTLQPHALVGLKKLTHLEIDCKCEALDLSHCEHIQSINLNHGVTLLPLSLNNYKTLQSIKMLTTYDGLDLSLFENLNSLTINNNVKVLPKPLLIHNKLTHIKLHGFDFNSVDNYAVHTWCLLNGADPVTCADFTPVLHSIEYIELTKSEVNAFTWLRSLLSTMLTLDHKVTCDVMLKDLFLEYAFKDEKFRTEIIPDVNTEIITDVNNTCTITVFFCDYRYTGLGETLHGLNVKHLRLHCMFWVEHAYLRQYEEYLREYERAGLKTGLNVHNVPHVPLLSRSLTYLSQLETLAVFSSEYIDLQLPPSLKYLTVCYDMSPSELRHLMNKLSACTQSLECRLEFACVKIEDDGTINKFPPEEYIPIRQELDALEHVEVKRFRIYDRTPNTDYRSSAAWSVRDIVADDGDYVNNIIDDEFFKCFLDSICSRPFRLRDFDINRISIGLQIN